MTDELATRLRNLGINLADRAADRIEALVKERDDLEATAINAAVVAQDQRARAERLEAALREIAKPYAADQSRLIHSEAQIASIARAAIAAAKGGE